MRVLVIGGTLFIGRLLVEELLRHGHDVTVLHRNAGTRLPDGVEGLVGDRNDPDQVRTVLSGRRFDAVYDNVYDWQRGTTGEQVAATARACGDALRRYVFMSSVAAFPPGLDHGDDDAMVPPDDPNEYARNKADSERALFEMHRSDGFPAITIRPPFVYGPRNSFYREAFFWDRMRDGRPILVPEDGSRLMQFVFVGDIVRVCLRALEVDQVVGRPINVGVRPPVTQLELVRVLGRAAGIEPETRFIPRDEAVAAGGRIMGSNLYFAEYYDLPSITMKLDRMVNTLGVPPTPLEEGLRFTYDWWVANSTFPRPDYSFEDALLRRATPNPGDMIGACD